MVKRPNPQAAEPGYVTSRLNPDTGEPIVLYDGPVAGFKEKQRWIVVCAAHGSLVPETNQRRARALLRTPALWCESCRRAATPLPTLHVVPFPQRTPEEQERELRFMAQKAKDNPEKVALFEQVYGVSPYRFWD